MGEAEKTIKALRTENADFQRASAALVVKQNDASVQAGSQCSSMEVQTESIPFHSHSWQPRLTPKAERVVVAVASIQTDPQPITAVAATQTGVEKRRTQDACVGEEVPLRLALGAEWATEASWRDRYEEGMHALTKKWQVRWEESQAECARLKAEMEANVANMDV